MKNTKVIVIILLILVVIVLGYVYVTMKDSDGVIPPRNEESTASTTVTTGQTKLTESSKQDSNTYLGRDGVYVVQYTDKGFVPQQLQIPRGKSVRFVNMSSRGLRVFSDVTTDPKFTELNESKTIGKSGTYTFSFVIEGLWAYHNEVQPSDKANIIVY